MPRQKILSSPELIPLSYLVLACIGEGGATTPEIVDMAERGESYLWTAAASQVYAEPKRLLRLGYVEAAKQPGKTRSRTRYTLTNAGRAALREWLARPSSFPRLQHEAAIRMLAGDMIDPEVLVESLRGLREETVVLEAGMPEIAERAKLVPHRTRYLLLQLRLIARLLEAHRLWVDEVEEALEPGARDRTVG